MFKDRLKDNDLIALIQAKQDRIKDILDEEQKLQEELVLLTTDLMRRGIEMVEG